MIAEEVEMIAVEPAIIARAENVARKNYKIVNWLKVISMHLQNQHYAQVDAIIRNEIHENFVMQEGFWDNEIKRKFSKTTISLEDIDFLMLALDDGPYFTYAGTLAKRIVEDYLSEKLKLNFTLSILEKIVNLFNYDKKNGSQFYKHLRTVYEKIGNAKKIRECYEREIKQAFDDFDMAYDQYKLWQKEVCHLERMKTIYDDTKKKWEAEIIDFDETRLSKLNVRRSLFQLEYRSVIEEKQFTEWIELLPTQADKLWFLRRWVLNYRQLMNYYLMKCEQVYLSDQEKIITKYRVAIRLSQSNPKIQQKYIYYLTRRINKHLTMPDQLEQDYSSTWGQKVAFFREQINALISKERKSINSAEQEKIYNRYYKLWIEIEQNIVKDKDMVCKLYENLIKNKKEKEDFDEYQPYAKSLIQLNALKDAKNVLKRYVYHAKNQQSRNTLQRFIGLYGNIEDEIQLSSEQRSQLQKKNDLAITSQQVNQVMVMEQQRSEPINNMNTKVDQVVNNHEKNEEIVLPKRQRNKQLDAVEQKIEGSMRKKLHVDGENTVFMKGIPTVWTESDVLNALKLSNNVNCVRLIIKNGVQKDYCYIQFDSKQSAEEELRTNTSGYKLDISRPPGDYDESKTLFICALPQTTTDQKIRSLFSTYVSSIVDIRLKLEKDKNYAYVEFDSKENKEAAFTNIHHENLVIDGKKILVQYCDSSRQKNKKFAQVIFLKHFPYKAVEKDVEDFFKNMKIANIFIPRSDEGKSKGFAYVEFEKFKDYQTALDMHKGSLFGRQFQILKSDREITLPNRNKHGQKHGQPDVGKSNKPRDKRNHSKPSKQPESSKQAKDNNYFSNLFK